MLNVRAITALSQPDLPIPQSDGLVDAGDLIVKECRDPPLLTEWVIYHFKVPDERVRNTLQSSYTLESAHAFFEESFCQQAIPDEAGICPFWLCSEDVHFR